MFSSFVTKEKWRNPIFSHSFFHFKKIKEMSESSRRECLFGGISLVFSASRSISGPHRKWGRERELANIAAGRESEREHPVERGSWKSMQKGRYGIQAAPGEPWTKLYRASILSTPTMLRPSSLFLSLSLFFPRAPILAYLHSPTKTSRAYDYYHWRGSDAVNLPKCVLQCICSKEFFCFCFKLTFKIK